ncbi:protein phosphatase [Candidatus Woesearchaeota archaeon CG10_big_fil_rev_8_21_14_0_10_45_16]|nr:MAG: protein phosphatase [Candidatus Woesearchaeota archaeon CG10_big_fil_rev_8_21_14_0_10_45_16]
MASYINRKDLTTIMAKHGSLLFEYSQITPNIYVGTNMCCQTHFKKVLVKKGISADISLEQERVDKPFGVSYYCWLPTKDHTPPDRKQLLIGVQLLTSLISHKEKAYVHCQRGHGRAPTLVAAYLISQGKSVEDAIDLIKKKRPSIHLEKNQILALKRFGKFLKR